MKRMILLFVAATVLAGCSSGPTRMTHSGEKYFSEHKAKYNVINLTLSTSNERKAVNAGYMSDDALRNYIKENVRKRLEEMNLVADDGLPVTIDLHLSRTYSWGKTTSMANLKYRGSVVVNKDDMTLADFRLNGQIQDNSIVGSFKTVFAKNDASEEKKYVDTLVEGIVEDLPK